MSDDPSSVSAGQTASNALLRAFFESAPLLMGVLERGESGLIHRTANPRAVELYGLSPDDIAGSLPRDLGFSAREIARWEAAVDRCIALGEPVQFDTVHPWDQSDEDEGVRLLTVTVSPVEAPDASSNTLYSYIGEDVTAMRRTARERSVLAAAVEQAAEAIIVTDSEASFPGPRILYANVAHSRMFGYPLDEIVGRSPRIFQGPKTDRAVLDRVRAAMAAGEPMQAEAINYRRDGTPFRLEWEIAPVKDAAGEIQYWIGTQRDVTNRHRLEREVLEVATREQERMARDLHDGLGQVLVGTTFRLEALRGALARVREGGDIDIDSMMADVSRTRDLVGHALAQARAIARGLSPVDVAEGGLLSALHALATDASEAYGIDCTFEVDHSLDLDDPDAPAHLYRIAQEALANAARHGRARTVAISICHSEGEATLSICDDGIGISDSAPDETDGLGLRTMAYRAARVGGTLTIQKGEPTGTEVRVRLAVSNE